MKRKLRIGVPVVALVAGLVAAGVPLAVRPWEGEEATAAGGTPSWTLL